MISYNNDISIPNMYYYKEGIPEPVPDKARRKK